jgi:cytochrome P450
MDEGPAYHRAADRVTAAIQQITRAQAHGLTRTIAGKVLDGHLALSQGLSDSPLDLKWYAETVLAKLCQAWFGIGDDPATGFAHGGWSWSTPAAELRCPGHFAAPSRYIFQPNPGDTAAAVGQQHGAQARERMAGVVARLRQAPQVPPVVAAILATEADDDAAGRTLIGVLMGFLPTVHGNFLATANAWTTDGTFWDLQLAQDGPLAIESTEAIEASALYQAVVRGMRITPVPDMVWRTATRRHRLGAVEVEAGDKVVVGINSATLDPRVTDPAQALRAVFGGTRGNPKPGGPSGPLHACPGFDMAMGVLLGLHEALLARPQLRPNPGALAVSVKPAG